MASFFNMANAMSAEVIQTLKWQLINHRPYHKNDMLNLFYHLTPILSSFINAYQDRIKNKTFYSELLLDLLSSWRSWN
jgi:hypothetical protein